MNVICPGDSSSACTRNSIFLVGPTPRHFEVQSWRPQAIYALQEAGFTGDVLAPEPFAGNAASQILWELEGLEICGAVAAWVPRDLRSMPGFTTNIEIGRWIDSGKLVYGRPNWAAHTGYLDFVYEDVYSRKAADTLPELMNSAIQQTRLATATAGEKTLETHRVADSKTRFSRWCWFLPGPPQPHPLCVVLDAEYYLVGMSALKLLRDALNQQLIPPMSFLFVSNVDEPARHTDYACNIAFAEFIAEKAVNWARKLAPGVQSSGNFICGLSLSGLQSAFTAMQFPNVFNHVISQSGSFWHEEAKFIAQSSTTRLDNSRFWLSVGDEETQEYVEHTPQLVQKISQVRGVEQAAAALGECGADVKLNVYNGGHSILAWQRELVKALEWLTVDVSR